MTRKKVVIISLLIFSILGLFYVNDSTHAQTFVPPPPDVTDPNPNCWGTKGYPNQYYPSWKVVKTETFCNTAASPDQALKPEELPLCPAPSEDPNVFEATGYCTTKYKDGDATCNYSTRSIDHTTQKPIAAFVSCSVSWESKCDLEPSDNTIGIIAIVQDEEAKRKKIGCKIANQLHRIVPFSPLATTLIDANASQMACHGNNIHIECNDSYIGSLAAGNDLIVALTSSVDGGTAMNGIAHVSALRGSDILTTVHELGHILSLADEYVNNSLCTSTEDRPNVISLPEKQSYTSDSDVTSTHRSIPWLSYITSTLLSSNKLGSPVTKDNKTGLFRGGLCDSNDKHFWIPNNTSVMNGYGRSTAVIPPYHMAIMIRSINAITGADLPLPNQYGQFPCNKLPSSTPSPTSPAPTTSPCYSPTPQPSP